MSNELILYVDDEADLRLVVGACLEDAGLRVLEAENAADGMKLALAEQPDLILSDVMMPDETGFEFCVKLKANPLTRNIPVIFITVMADEEQGIKVGGAAFVTKPFDDEDLIKTIKDVLSPGDTRTILDAALEHLRANAIEQAVSGFEEVLSLESTGPLAVWAHYYLGQIHHHQGELERAAGVFGLAIELDSSFWRAHTRLGLLLETSNVALAKQHFERSLSLNSNQADVVKRLQALKGRS